MDNWVVISWFLGAAVSALLLTTGHWFPWGEGRLPRLWAYVYGTTALLVGFAIWRGLNGDWQTPVGLAGLAAVGGFLVKVAYCWDALQLRVHQARKAEDTDEELQG